MDNQKQRLLKKLSMMREDDFTKSILKPLFEAMGYKRVDFNGGPLERGRDLIAQIRVPPKREPEIIYIQSKKLGKSQTTKDSAKYMQILHQLGQCCTEEVTTIDGAKLKADKIYLACPEQLTTRFIDEISGQIFCMFGKKIMPYDGPQILEDIETYLPSLISELTNIDEDMLKHNNDALINTELLAALKNKKDITLDIFYSDLNFFVGSIDSNYLLHLQPEILNSELLISQSEWETTKKYLLEFADRYDIQITKKSFPEIERKYKADQEHYLSKDNKERIDRLLNLEQDILSLVRRKKEAVTALKALLGSRFSEKNTSSDSDKRIYEDQISTLDSIRFGIEKWRLENKNLLNETPKDDFFYPKLKDLIETSVPIEEMGDEISTLKKIIVPEPKYEIKFDSEKILEKIIYAIKSYKEAVDSINSGSCGPTKLKSFLKGTEKTLSLIGQIKESSSPLSQVISFTHKNNLVDRVSISPHDIFSTGHDIAVYGGAGVGKTTTLQAYVTFFTESENKTLVYVPLNRLIQKYRSFHKDADTDIARQDLIQKLILISKNQEPTKENIDKLNLLFQRNVALILDGLDEIYNTVPFILSEISEFKSKYPNVQLIISSRDCVSYLEDINFLGITLLPFTPEQLKKFIRGWLADENKADKLLKSIEKKGLYEHIKTPLLATISCSLVERGIDALSSEYEIYSERLNLLTGEYDDYKKISRQTQKREHLSLCARKVAYAMHQRNIRSITKSDLHELAITVMPESFGHDVIKSCLEELIDPCNLMIQDSLTGNYSFGHFRFQEHLASKEISLNRSIDITELTVQDWWRGALCLYAQENDISLLFEEIYNKYGNIQKSKISLQAMILNSPKARRSSLKALFKGYEHADKLDADYLIGIDDDLNYDSFHY